ncbi:hypothetical protein EDD18DRAFT_1126774 [Armillaria luteobubalina]|uniref:Uncharacterized protein n=1 Tax=Armillaria luteobubalina TaxID=153913 RepID=A0AA39QM41_9AGAR|nr:hypothetical protein EDD18DRAFT_1126774 [Armillaria luteobubalina]
MLRFFLSRRVPSRLVTPPTLRARSFTNTRLLLTDVPLTSKHSQDARIRGKKSKQAVLEIPLTIPFLAISETVEAATLGRSIIAACVSEKDQPATIAALIDKLPSEPGVSKTIVLFKESSTATNVHAFLRAQDRRSVELVDTSEVSEAARTADVALISGIDNIAPALSHYDPYECKSLILCGFEPDKTLLEVLARFNPRAKIDAPRTHYVPSSERTPIVCLMNVEQNLTWSYERNVSFSECYFRTWNFPPRLSFLPADNCVNNFGDDYWTSITDIVSSSGRTIIYTSNDEMSQEVYDGLYRKAVTACIVRSKDDLIYDQKIKAYIISADSTFFNCDIEPCGNVMIFHPARSIEEYLHMHSCGRNLQKRSAQITEVIPSDQMNFVSLSGIRAAVPIEIQHITPDLLTKIQHGHVPFPDEKDLSSAKRIQVSHGGAEQRLRSEVATILQVVPKFADAVGQNQVEAYVSGGIAYKAPGTFGTAFFRQQQSYDPSAVKVKIISKEGFDTKSAPLVDDIEETTTEEATEEFRDEDEYGRVANEPEQDRWGRSSKQARYRSKKDGQFQTDGRRGGWDNQRSPSSTYNSDNRRPQKQGWEHRQSWNNQERPRRSYDSDNRRPQKQGWEEGRNRQSWNNQERLPRTYGSDNDRPPKQDWEQGRNRQPWNNRERMSSRSDRSENLGQSGWRNKGSHNGRGFNAGATSWS